MSVRQPTMPVRFLGDPPHPIYIFRVVENFSEVSSKSTVGLIEDEESITGKDGF